MQGSYRQECKGEKMKPVVFCNRSVLAWQAHAKTQTRRLVKPQPDADDWCLRQLSDGRWRYGAYATEDRVYWLAQVRQPYAPDDLLWIREALKRGKFGYVLYETHPFDYLREEDTETGWRWTWKRNKLPAMFMPRFACRYYARVVSVRPERLRHISHIDALAEGVWAGRKPTYRHASGDYLEWWDSMHKKPGTRSQDNPWVFVYGLEDADAS